MACFSLRRAKDLICLARMSGPFMVTAKVGGRNAGMLVD